MKNTFLIFLLSLVPFTGYSQSPDHVSLEIVIRDSTSHLVTYHDVGVKVSVLLGSEKGDEVYIETHHVKSNKSGVISYEIGDGNAKLGDFRTIDWDKGPYFVRIETDPKGGEQYAYIGTIRW